MVITQKTSPNKFNGRTNMKPDMIVCHITEGSYAGAVSWLCNPDSKASSHFVVSKKGEITQLVPIKDSAWCNGTDTEGGNVDCIHSPLKAVRDRKTNANYYTVSIEHEGIYAQTKGALTVEQQAATTWLIEYIRNEVKRIYGTEIPLDREHIVGHYQITPITKPHCPGEKFPFDAIINELKGEDTCMNCKTYHLWTELSGESARVMHKMVDNGFYNGSLPSDLNLQECMLRSFIIQDRAGLWDLLIANKAK